MQRLRMATVIRPKVTLLDGGTGEELFTRGLPDDRRIWSASALVHDQYHALLREVHTSFLSAGSDCITSNNYGVTPGAGFSDEEIVRYTTVAGQLAREACDLWAQSASDDKKLKVCGSLPPLLESYRADRVPEHDEGVRLYAMIASTLGPYVDCYLAETLSSVQEAKMVLLGVQQAWSDAAEKEDRPEVMVSFTLNSHGRLRSGENVCDAVQDLLDGGEVKADLQAVLFNCSQPEAISKALSELKNSEKTTRSLQERRLRLGAYANRLTAIPDDWTLAESTEPQAMRTDLEVDIYVEFVSEWIALGAEIVGGCCGVGPEYIANIHRILKDQGRR
ncbi:hypothetical protein PHYBOEH_011920 [Phytophthora boehmeriae]|uniref:Hcy-binding domain-containing protein n=1 Tax=Phytophthora boehmeriae TaxID=109152 RepID=A0A8T1VEF2_9STRA|nr:hypothetical protein PHYBOEH_011920 [Phytophthora boehmeriae]